MSSPPPGSAHPPFDQLLAEARVGSAAALGALLDHYRLYLLQIANQELDAGLRRKVGVSDVVQQTFLEAQRDFRQFAGSSDRELTGWLRRILHHNLLQLHDQFHTQKRQVGRESRLDQMERLTDSTLSPSRRLMQAEDLAALEAALAQLSEDCRQVILLHNRDHQTFVEIAQALGRSPDAVRKLWVRAVDALRLTLSDRDHHDAAARP